MNAVLTSIGLSTLKAAIAWILKPAVFSKIKAGVILLLNADMTGEEKRERVMAMAQETQFAASGGKTVLSEDILEIAVRGVYLLVTGKPTEVSAGNDQ